MTKEQIEKLGITFVEGMTDEQVFDALTKQKGELKAERDKFEADAIKNKGLVDKYSSEIAKLNDERKAKLTDDEKAKEHLAELETEVATLKREKSVSDKVAKYVKLGYSEELAKEIAQGEIEGKDVSALHEQFIKSHDEALKKELLKNSPTPKGGADGGTTYTKEDFKAGKISMEEMNRLKETDPATYKSLISEQSCNVL